MADLRPDPLADPREREPATAPRPALPELVTEGTCGREASSILGTFKCTHPSSWAAQLGCGHEHFLSVEICDCHRPEFMRNVPRQVCQPCLESGSLAHSCPVMIVRETELAVPRG